MTRSIAPPSSNSVRGQGFRSALQAIEDLFGAEGRQQALRVMDPVVSEAFRYGKIVAAGWFPIEWYTDVHRAAASIGAPRSDIHRTIGAITARQDIQGVYRFMLGFASPTFMLAHVGRIIGSFIKDVHYEFLERSPTGVVIRFEIPGASRAIWEDIAGGTEVLLGFCGAKSPETFVRPKPAAGSAELYATWAEPS